MAANDTLIQMIEGLVNEKTFSLDAVEAIKKLRDKAELLQTQLADLTKRNLEHIENNAKLTREKEELRDQLNTWKNRESELKKREDKMHELDIRTAVAQAKSEAYFDSMKVVFAPNIVRNSIQDFSTRNNAQSEYDSRTGQSASRNDTSNDNRTVTDSTVEGYARPGDPDQNGGFPKNTL
jgi:regulator of replication initiation timing